MDQVLDFLHNHQAIVITVGSLLYEVLGRLTPTVKRASILSWVGKACKGVGEICFILSDMLSKIVPDKIAEDKIVVIKTP